MTTAPAAPDPVRAARALVKAGEHGPAATLLADAVRRGLPALRLHAAGRLLARSDGAAAAPAAGPRVHVLGELTTGWLTPMLRAWGAGLSATGPVTEGGFDVVLQELFAMEAGAADVVVLVPWAGARADRLAPDSELARWQACWARAQALGMRVIQVGLDLPGPGSAGHLLSSRPGGLRDRVRDCNRALRENIPDDAIFVDLEAIAGDMGRRAFYEPRRWYWTKQPMSEAGTALLARHLASATKALTRGPCKVLVLDCDNTLWGGVVGELGPHGVELGEGPQGQAFRDFQQWCKDLTGRGILLAVATKNEPEDARAPFEQNTAMVLKLDDLLAFEAHWEPKSLSLQRIAATLNLGVDALAFFDDNPAEREQVRQALPQVTVIEVPPDPVDYVRAIEDSLAFEAPRLTAADAARVDQYKAETARKELSAGFAKVEDYLASLDMVGELREIDASDLPRVVQLVGKTNQWNLTTRRHPRARVEEMIATPGAVCRTLRLRDRFGDHGLVGVVLAVPDGDGVLRVDTWLMSCRVIARTAEQFVWQGLVDAARAAGHTTIVGDHIPTAKNRQVAELYARLGLEAVGPVPGAPDGSRRFSGALATLAPPPTWVAPAP